jgi:hypothetical protein
MQGALEDLQQELKTVTQHHAMELQEASLHWEKKVKNPQ